MRGTDAISTRGLVPKERMLNAMLLAKLRIACSLLALAALIGAGAALFPHPTPAQDNNPAATDRQEPRSSAPPVQTKPEPGQPKGGNPAGIVLRKVRLKEMNAEAGTISATVGDQTDAPQLVNLPLAQDAPVLVNDKPVKVNILTVGMQVSLRLTADGDRLVVAAVLVDAWQVVASERYGEAMITAFKWRSEAIKATQQVKQAEYELDVAKGQQALEKAQARLKHAKVQVLLAE